MSFIRRHFTANMSIFIYFLFVITLNMAICLITVSSVSHTFYLLGLVTISKLTARGALMHGLQGAEAQGPTLERGPTG